MLKLNKTALADALSALDKNNMVKPYLTANNISVVSNLRTLTVHALSDAEAQGLDLVPLSNFYNAYLQGVKDTDTLLAETIEDIKFYINSQPRLDINTLLWFQMNLAYNKVGSFHIAPLTYDDKMVILMANGLFQYTVTVRASYGVNEVTVLFNTNDSGFKIDLLTGAILGNPDTRNFSVYQTVYNQKEIKNVKAEMVKQIKNVDSFGLEETYLKANDDAFTAINKHLKYLIH